MRKFMFTLGLFLLIGFQVFAQNTVTGTVTNADDQTTIPGVNVIVKGTTVGTMTNLDGNYSLNVPEGSTTLVFSFVGLKSQEVVITGSEVNAAMQPEATEIDVIVVTALGIKKNEKALGYASTKVGGADIMESRDKSAMNSLQGKVAGVNITQGSGAPGSSTRVIMRGLTSINGSNQPLYVIDGVPMNNSVKTSDDELNGGTDFGNAANDLNPDDVESINVLKGSTGAALYGSRASNGVILITTKKGKMGQKNKGLEIKYTGTATFDTPLRLPQFQNEFGQGAGGAWDMRENTSFGPKFDNEMRYWGYTVDGQRMIKPYSAIPNNAKDFFDIGKTYSHSLSFTGGNEQSSFYASYSFVDADGFMPYAQDVYKRHTFALRGSAILTNNFTASGSLNYIKKINSFVPTGQDAAVFDNILQSPRDIPITEMMDYNNKFFNKDNYYGLYTTNPYWVLKENGNANNDDRVFGNGELSYKVNENINILGRAGFDVSNSQTKGWRAIFKPEGHNAASSQAEGGQVQEDRDHNYEITTDVIMTFNKTFGDFGVSGLVGHNFNANQTNSNSAYVSQLDVPNFYYILNSSSTPILAQSSSKRRILGGYGQASLSYKYVYLEGSLRQDYSSTLPLKKNSYWYYSVTSSFVITDAFPVLQSFLTFGKIRLGYSLTGKDARVYSINPVFPNSSMGDGFTTYSLPSAGVNGYEVGNLVGNSELSPEFTKESEIGSDLRFWGGRIGIDATYYQKVSTDLIYAMTLPSSSGYSTQWTNLGKIENKGVELQLILVPIKAKDFQWEMTIGYTKNKNKLVELIPGKESEDWSGLSTVGYRLYIGMPMGVFEGPTPLKDSEGHLIVNAQGYPQDAPKKTIYGNGQYDFMTSLTNKLTYKGFSLSCLFDWRKGGLMYSRTASITYFAGSAINTLYNDREPFIIPGSVKNIGTEEAPIYVENDIPVTSETLGASPTTFWGYGGLTGEQSSVIPKSFLKLRELGLTYNLPKKIIERAHIGSASISIVGRNLVVWTPKENRFIDPEVTTFGNDAAGDFGEFSATPSARSLGFSLQFTF